jgi:S1-C subfamily serine protease
MTRHPATPTRRDWLVGAGAAWLATAAAGPALAQTGSAATPAGLPALMRRMRGSVVPVGVFNPLANPRFGFRGTAFAVGDGSTFVTNAHVLPDPAATPVPQLALAIPAADGHQVRKASTLRIDRGRDIALLRLEGPGVPPLPLAERMVEEGTDVALIGFPVGGVLGFSPVIHRGIVASVTTVALPAPTSGQLDARAAAQLRGGAFQVYQLDATAYPGNSGGPVIDVSTGEVIAVVNSVLVRGTRESALSAPTGITYAIPARFAGQLLDSK